MVFNQTTTTFPTGAAPAHRGLAPTRSPARDVNGTALAAGVPARALNISNTILAMPHGGPQTHLQTYSGRGRLHLRDGPSWNRAKRGEANAESEIRKKAGFVVICLQTLFVKGSTNDHV
jgi:hypothetical protein